MLARGQHQNNKCIFSIPRGTRLAERIVLRYTTPMPDEFDPTTITDPTLRAVVQTLMNQVETLHEQTRTQAAEIQRLRDEIARLKGEQGKPDSKPSRPPAPRFPAPPASGSSLPRPPRVRLLASPPPLVRLLVGRGRGAEPTTMR